MPVTLSKMAANTASFSMPVGDDSVTITYYPQRVSEKTYASLQVLADQENTDMEQNTHALNDVLISLVASWDVLRDDGTPVPITHDALPEVPIPFRGQVVNAIMADIRGNATAAQTTN